MIDYAKMIRDEVAAAERRIVQHIANLIQQTTITNPTASGNEDGADGWPDAGARYQRSPRRYQHFGFRSVPPKNAAAIMALVGGGSTAEVTIAEDGSAWGPDPGAEGVAIFSSKSGAYITIDKNGVVTVTAPTGQKVVVAADSVYLGAEAGSQFVALANKVQGYLLKIEAAVAAWTPVPNDGGLAFKTQLTTQNIGNAAGFGSDCGAAQVKAK